jgi:hypothetical protein
MPPEGHRPGEQEGDLEVEDDEEDRHEVEPHVELHPRVVEGVEAAFVGRELLGIGVARRSHGGGKDQDQTQTGGEAEEDQDREILPQEVIHVRLLPRVVPRVSLAGSYLLSCTGWVNATSARFDLFRGRSDAEAAPL